MGCPRIKSIAFYLTFNGCNIWDILTYIEGRDIQLKMILQGHFL